MATIRTMLYTDEAWTKITATPEGFLTWCVENHLLPSTVKPTKTKRRPGWVTVDAMVAP